MARIARVVAPNLPHHVTQRGNRRQETFFCEEDYQEYIRLIAEWCSRWHVEVWALIAGSREPLAGSTID